MKIVRSPQVTVMVVQNSIFLKPSLIGYQQLGDKCNIIDVLPKKSLTVRHPYRFVMLFCIPAEGDHFEYLLQLLIIIITFVKLSVNTFAHNSFRSHLQTDIHRNFFRPLNPPEHVVYV
jgi:hypothetical protein